MTTDMTNLPTLPYGWGYREGINGSIWATNDTMEVDIYIDYDGINIEHAANGWWAPVEVVVAVLKANGVAL